MPLNSHRFAQLDPTVSKAENLIAGAVLIGNNIIIRNLFGKYRIMMHTSLGTYKAVLKMSKKS